MYSIYGRLYCKEDFHHEQLDSTACIDHNLFVVLIYETFLKNQDKKLLGTACS